ncbi:hypothetical protein C8A00DRAFT_38993 [Chaetomidium leptoderma]|uniref:Uncharacterized protein n=1 Tax=Chaetomidium leptoderma TaxID=669021 RepID=A0AAN6VDC6_9PEZI|nr:hypothetical protein C8A00DRAFT_38993 [Chaetomidium leptoderma]
MQFTTLAAAVLGLASSALAVALPNPIPDFKLETRACQASHWSCNGTALQICNGRDWVTTANCARPGCCSVTDGGLNAHCTC